MSVLMPPKPLPVAPTLINLTINGRKLQARPGQTVMEAAEAAGIHIPGLCHQPHLKPEGACRLCLVEIEKQRTLQPACTFPVTEGMVVQTESDKCVASRKESLHLLFSERAHYCMLCPMSGTGETSDCELQRLGYQYGLDLWAYGPDYAKPWPLDASRKYFVMDHARCILCRRCIRACNQVAANHTLGVQQRGARTMVCADDDVPFGQSTCVSCGTCLQVCPTGALFDRRSVYLGHDAQATRAKTTCMACAVGCGIEALTRDNQLLRIESDWDAPNAGLMCVAGRFDATEPMPPRILWPMVRQPAEAPDKPARLAETSWDKALTLIAERFATARRVAGLASPRLTTESLTALTCFFHEVLQSNELALLYGEVPPRDLGQPATLPDIALADCIAVIGGDPLLDQKVVGYFVKRALDNAARLLVIDDAPTLLDPLAHQLLPLHEITNSAGSSFHGQNTYHLRVSGIAKLREAIDAAARPVILYGPGLSATVLTALRNLPAKVRLMPLVKGTNAAGAARLGLHTRPVSGDAVLLMLGDDLAPTANPLPGHGFTVVWATYRSPWTDAADVALPAPAWTEEHGHITDMTGRTHELRPLIQPPRSVHGDAEALLRLAVRMGYGLSYSDLSHLTGHPGR